MNPAIAHSRIDTVVSALIDYLPDKVELYLDVSITSLFVFL